MPKGRRDLRPLAAAVIENSKGVLGAQIIALGSMPIASRLYTPTDFGNYAIQITTIGIVAAIGTLSLDRAIPFANTHLKFQRIVVSSVSTSVLWALIVFSLGIFAGQSLGLDFDKIILISTGAAVVAIYSVITQSSFRAAQIRNRSRALILGALVTAGARIVFSFLLPGAFALIAAYLTGLIVGAAYILKSSFRLRIAPIVRKSSFIASTLRNERAYIVYTLPTVLMRYSANFLPVYIIAHLAGLGNAGQFSLALATVCTPIQFLADAFGDAVKRQVAVAASEDPEAGCKLVMSIASRSSTIAAVGYVTLVAACDLLFNTAFGEDWMIAGRLVPWLALNLSFYFAIVPITSSLPAFFLQRMLFRIEVSFLPLKCIVLATLLEVNMGLVVSVAAFSFVGVVQSLTTLQVFRRFRDTLFSEKCAALCVG